MNKTEGNKFIWIEKQDKGEPDAVAGSYALDYKLFSTRTSLQAMSLTSGAISKLSDGCIAFGVSKLPKGEQFTYVRTVAALQKYSLEDLKRISENPQDKIEENVAIILKNLSVKKNLFFFYPFILSFSVPHQFADGCIKIEEAFNEDLGRIRAYRKLKASEHETFLSTIFDNKLLIFQDTENAWKYQDSVDMMSSEIYKELYYSYGNRGFNYRLK